MGWRDFQVSTPVDKIDKIDKSPLMNALTTPFVDIVDSVEGPKTEISITSCFSPDGTLEAAFREAIEDRWTDDTLCVYIDALREAGALQAPWGLMVRDSSLVGEPYWIVSDESAKMKIPTGAMHFTLGEFRPVADACRVFEGAVVKVIRHKGKGT